MGLTRPNSSQINSDIVNISDAVITMNATIPQPVNNINDVGIIVTRGTAENNAVMVWNENTDTFIFGMTTDDGSTSGPVATTSLVDIQVNTIIDSTGSSFLSEDSEVDGGSF